MSGVSVNNTLVNTGVVYAVRPHDHSFYLTNRSHLDRRYGYLVHLLSHPRRDCHIPTGEPHCCRQRRRVPHASTSLDSRLYARARLRRRLLCLPVRHPNRGVVRPRTAHRRVGSARSEPRTARGRSHGQVSGSSPFYMGLERCHLS